MVISSPTTRSTFPACAGSNLQIEHELYCHGHLIEAGVSHYEATGAHRPARDCPPRRRPHRGRFPRQRNRAYTPGHEEIEIALLALVSGDRTIHLISTWRASSSSSADGIPVLRFTSSTKIQRRTSAQNSSNRKNRNILLRILISSLSSSARQRGQKALEYYLTLVC